MKSQIQYVTDAEGQKTSVIVSYKKWEKMNDELVALKTKIAVFKSIRDGMKEVKQARKSGKKLQSATDYINEIRSQNR